MTKDQADGPRICRVSDLAAVLHVRAGEAAVENNSVRADIRNRPASAEDLAIWHRCSFEQPVEGERARYACTCGEQASKDLRTGEMLPTKHRVRGRDGANLITPRSNVSLGGGCGFVRADIRNLP